MTWPRAPESGVDRRITWAIFFISMLVFIASWFSIAIPDLDVLGSLVLLRANQLSSPAQKQVMRLVRAAIVLSFS